MYVWTSTNPRWNQRCVLTGPFAGVGRVRRNGSGRRTRVELYREIVHTAKDEMHEKEVFLVITISRCGVKLTPSWSLGKAGQGTAG